MKWSDVKTLVGNAAPLLGTALAGPAGGVAGTLIAKALGVDETPEAVAAEIKRDPQALVKLREIESNERVKLQECALDTLRAELADTQGARDAHKNSNMPAIICCSLTVIVAVSLYAILKTEIPEGNRDLVFYLFGQVTSAWLASIAYFVGTTRSSGVKTQMLGGKQ